MSDTAEVVDWDAMAEWAESDSFFDEPSGGRTLTGAQAQACARELTCPSGRTAQPRQSSCPIEGWLATPSGVSLVLPCTRPAWAHIRCANTVLNRVAVAARSARLRRSPRPARQSLGDRRWFWAEVVSGPQQGQCQSALSSGRAAGRWSIAVSICASRPRGCRAVGLSEHHRAAVPFAHRLTGPAPGLLVDRSMANYHPLPAPARSYMQFTPENGQWFREIAEF